VSGQLTAVPPLFVRAELGHGKRKNLYHCALRIDLVRPHSQAAIVLVPFTGLFRRTWDRSIYGTCTVVCHPERDCYARFVRFPSVWIPFLEFSSVLDDSGWLVFTFVRLRRLGEKCVPLDRRSAVDSICFLHTIPCLERAGLEHAADTSFSVT
jgi:hypothetical protein